MLELSESAFTAALPAVARGKAAAARGTRPAARGTARAEVANVRWAAGDVPENPGGISSYLLCFR